MLWSLALRSRYITGFTAGFVAFFMGLVTPASADLMLTIGPKTTPVTQPTAGTTTLVTLTAYLAANVGTESVESYAVPIDLSPPAGVGSPVGMRLTGATARTIFTDGAFADSISSGKPSGEGDILVSVTGLAGPPTPVDFGTLPTALFDFTISIDSTVALGDYSADVVRGVLLGFDPGLTGKVQFGTPAIIRVVAVPEPTTLGILGLVVVPFVLRRQRLSQPG